MWGSSGKEWIVVVYNSMDDFYRYYVELNKLEVKVYII